MQYLLAGLQGGVSASASRESSPASLELWRLLPGSFSFLTRLSFFSRLSFLLGFSTENETYSDLLGFPCPARSDIRPLASEKLSGVTDVNDCLQVIVFANDMAKTSHQLTSAQQLTAAHLWKCLWADPHAPHRRCT